MKDNIHEILNTSIITNIAMPRMWCKGSGCIAHDVGEITTAYFHEQMTDFRTFMSDDVSDEDIDKGWKSLCFQYESLAEDPQENGVYDRFFALAMGGQIMVIDVPDEHVILGRKQCCFDSGMSTLVSCTTMNGFDTPEEQATHYPKWD